MGITQHKTMIVTSFMDKKLKRAHKLAQKYFDKSLVTDIAGVGMNGYYSFMIATCGSKAGWSEDAEHIENIEKYSQHLDDKFAFNDGSSVIEYVILSHGECGVSVKTNRGDELGDELATQG